MRRHCLRLAIVIILVMFASSSSGQAVCGGVSESCEPSPDEVRAKIEQLVNSAWLTPHAIVSLQRYDARSFETDGGKRYEVRIFAVLNYSGDKLRCREKLCPELHNYLVNVDEVTKKVTIAGWLFFEYGKQGWR